jgi:hypothetical protein
MIIHLINDSQTVAKHFPLEIIGETAEEVNFIINATTIDKGIFEMKYNKLERTCEMPAKTSVHIDQLFKNKIATELRNIIKLPVI